MTDHEADTRQNWKGMGGATAYCLIERHAEGWEEVGQMMNAWLRANTVELRDQVAHLSLYKPARRTEKTPEPVKAIGPCNEPFWFGGIVETDEEFAERAGTPYEQDA